MFTPVHAVSLRRQVEKLRTAAADDGVSTEDYLDLVADLLDDLDASLAKVSEIPGPIINPTDGCPEWQTRDATVDVDGPIIRLWTGEGGEVRLTDTDVDDLVLALTAAKLRAAEHP